MSRMHSFRLIAALLIALFSGQAPAALAGNTLVICGYPAAVGYDFEKGAPADFPADAGWCDTCVSCSFTALLPAVFDTVRAEENPGKPYLAPLLSVPKIHAFARMARGPPAPVLI